MEEVSALACCIYSINRLEILILLLYYPSHYYFEKAGVLDGLDNLVR
jgi:hypothetical protein